jgi:hypothetical protein
LTIERAQALFEAITAPQPKQEPFGYFMAEPFGWTDCSPDDEGAIPLFEAPQPQPKQEPAEQRPPNCGTGFCSCIECPYTQPQREWLGLTDEDLREIESRMLDMGTVFDLMRLIETKLREKNGGGV